MRRRRHQPQSLTSMIDVLFILLFASLARATAPDAAPQEPEAPEAPEAEPPAPIDAAPAAPDAAPAAPPDYAAAAERGLARALERLGERPALVLRISAAGQLTAIETGVSEAPLAVEVPLLERVPDRDVGLAYLGDRNPDLQLCAVAARYRSIDDRLVVIAPAAPLADLSVALVDGMRRDVERCDSALAVIVDPEVAP